jgi:hypothetical protein
MADSGEMNPGIRGFFDGLSAAWFRGMTYSLTRFWAFDTSKAAIKRRGLIKQPILQSIAAGTVGGIVGGLVANPGGRYFAILINSRYHRLNIADQTSSLFACKRSTPNRRLHGSITATFFMDFSP